MERLGHPASVRREADFRHRHDDPCNGNGPSKFEAIEFAGLLQVRKRPEPCPRQRSRRDGYLPRVLTERCKPVQRDDALIATSAHIDNRTELKTVVADLGGAMLDQTLECTNFRVGAIMVSPVYELGFDNEVGKWCRE